MSWKDVWEKKGSSDKSHYNLSDLIKADGYDGAGFIAEDAWIEMIYAIESKLNLDREMTLCELGCGAGASLYPLYEKGYRKLWGIDYSPGLIDICNRVMPEGEFKVAEAINIPFDSSMFDAVLCTSVFQYFPDLAYAGEVVQEMLRVMKPNGSRGAILDINDVAKKVDYEQTRRGKLGVEEYERLYKNFPHLFYEKSWFEGLATKLGVDYKIEDQHIKGYANSKYRFNFYFSKK